MQDPELINEHINTLLNSPAWRIGILSALRPSIAQWNRDLLINPALPDDRRRGYIFAKRALYEGLKSLYVQQNKEIPKWLNEEFNVVI